MHELLLTPDRQAADPAMKKVLLSRSAVPGGTLDAVPGNRNRSLGDQNRWLADHPDPAELLPPDRFHITICDTPASALELLNQTFFDLVILISGATAAPVAAALSDLRRMAPDLPVIVLHREPGGPAPGRKSEPVVFLSLAQIQDQLLPAIQALLARPAGGPRAESASGASGEAGPEPTDRVAAAAGTVPPPQPAPADAERIHRLVLETMNEGCLLLAAEGTLRFANRACGRMAGLTVNELLGRDGLTLFAPATSRTLRQIMDRARPLPQALEFEGRLARHDGVLLPVKIAVHEFESDLLIVLADISEQVRVMEDIAQVYRSEREQYTRLQALLAASRDGVFLVGLDGEILFINRPARQLFQLENLDRTETWFGRSLWELVSLLRRRAPSLARDFLHEARRIRNGDRRPGSGEFRLGGLAVSWQSVPVADNFKLLGWLVMLRDVTWERQAELLRDDLTHTMVHDLRNPLSVIMNSIGLISHYDQANVNALSPKQRHYVDVAYKSSQKMLMLVNRILDMSRLESGRMPVSLQALEAGALIDGTIQEQRPLAQRKSIALLAAHPRQLPPVLADRWLLEQVLQNLVDNALKFTPEGGQVVIAASLVRREPATDPSNPSRPDPGHLEITVSDTGPGIPPEIQGRLFERFITGSQVGRGTGLGLSFCRLAVEAQGGQISATSRPEEGTRIRISLPLAGPGDGADPAA